MIRNLFLLLVLSLFPILSDGVGRSAERAFSWTEAPARGDYIGVDLNPYQLSKYLAECELNRPEIVGEIRDTFRSGKYYRKNTKDQKSRPVTITASVNNDYMLRIVTWRNDTCADCNGTGKRTAPFDKMSKHVNVNFNCLKCDGKGFLANNTTERFFVLSAEDFMDREEGRRIMRERAYAGAPVEAEQWVERLVSKNPRERLEACLWLDRNYVREGAEFQSIMPMLRKARYHEANPKKRVMVWQFWAGKDLPGERNRAFYRIYANTKNGKITRKGFYSAQ